MADNASPISRQGRDATLRTPRAVLISIALGIMLVPLNSTMIAVALPDIMHAFDANVRAAGWLVTAYLITMAALQLVTGQLGDHFGRRRLVLGALLYFGLASLHAALSPSLLVLLFARVQQAVAGSILVTNGIALAFEAVPEDRRGRDLGVLSAILVLAAAGGPPLGGLLVGVGSWRAIFWANLPIVVAALLFGSSATSEGERQRSKRLFDWGQIPSLFQRHSFARANGAIMFSNLGTYVLLLAIPILMSVMGDWSSLQTGLVLAVMSITTALFSPIGGRLSDRIGRRIPSVVGAALLALGVLPLGLLTDTTNISLLVVCLGLAGTGLGLSSVSLQTAALESVELQQTGVATGISSTSRYLGSIAGSLVLARLLGPEPIDAANFRAAFLGVSIAASLALLLSWGIRDNARATPLSHL